MSVSPPGHWLLNRMVFLLNSTLNIINSSVFNSIINLLKDANTFTGINTFKGGINVDNIDSINGNTTFNSEIIVNSNITANNGSFIGNNLLINNIEKNTDEDVSFQNSIDMSNNNIDNINTLNANELNIDVININTASNISVLNTIDMNNNFIINANISALNDSQINVENGLINARTLTLSDTNIYETNNFNLGARRGINVIGDTQINIWKGSNDAYYRLFLPENNGETNNNATITGGNQQTHTQSILAIGAFYKRQNSLQSLNNSQCYLIPPSMINSHIPELQGTTLFKTIGEQNENIRYLAGYPNTNISIHELKNTLVPTVGQIVDLLNYLGVTMNGKQDNLESTTY